MKLNFPLSQSFIDWFNQVDYKVDFNIIVCDNTNKRIELMFANDYFIRDSQKVKKILLGYMMDYIFTKTDFAKFYGRIGFSCDNVNDMFDFILKEIHVRSNI